MDSYRQKGKRFAYVFDITHYELDRTNEQRSPTDKEVLTSALREINFEVMQYHCGSIRGGQLQNFLASIIFAFFPKSTSGFMLIVSGHGDEEGVFASDDCYYTRNFIVSTVANNRSLKGVLKWIIFATCHGSERHISIRSAEVKAGNHAPKKEAKKRLLAAEDVFVTYKAPHGFSATERDFLGEFAALLRELHKTGTTEMSIDELSTKLNRRVFDSNTPTIHKVSQYTSTKMKCACVRFVPPTVLPSGAVRLSGAASLVDPLVRCTVDWLDEQLNALLKKGVVKEPARCSNADRHLFECVTSSVSNAFSFYEEFDRKKHAESNGKPRLCKSETLVRVDASVHHDRDTDEGAG